jgi:hypothetical protein
MSILLNKALDIYDKKCDNSITPLDRGSELGTELQLVLVGLSRSLYAEKDKLNLWRFSKRDMNKLYQKLAKLEQELVAAKTQDEKDAIEDEIWEVQDEIDQLENDKYGDDANDDY